MNLREIAWRRLGSQCMSNGVLSASASGLIVLGICGCASNRVAADDTKEKLIYQLSVNKEPIDPKNLTSQLFGLPRLEHAYDRLSKLCKRDGGDPGITSGRTAIPGNSETMYAWLPIRIVCVAPGGLESPGSWVIEPSYVHSRKTWSDGAVTLEVSIKPTLTSGAEYVQRNAMAQEQATEIERRTREAQLEQRRRAKEAADLAQRQDDERRARAPAFRDSVRAGDRMRLANAGPETSGLVIEVKRPLVFVQFDSMTVMGESRRWVNIAQIEPMR